jgi:Mg2+ and Co2+ transporter CorA
VVLRTAAINVYCKRRSAGMKLGSVSLSSGALVAAIFGMNLHSTLEESQLAFLSVTGGLVGISGLVFLGGAAYCRYKRLL